ncbi:MAG: hypothetical protein ACOYUZ_03725 [Patescibacteria group bacterium]
MTSIADQFKDKIERGEMPEPIPRWQVRAKHAGLWFLFGSFVIIGIISTGVAFWFVTDPQGLIAEYRQGSFLSNFLDFLPLFWILFSLGTGVAALAIFIHAPRGYRYRTTFIGGVLVLSFIALGGAVSAVGLSEKIEFLAAEKLPGYYLIQRPRMQKLIRPDMGMVAGRVQGMDKAILLIRDPHGITWQVDVSECDTQRAERIIEESPCVRAFGSASTSINVFEAKDLMPCPRGVRIQMLNNRAQEPVKEQMKP